MVALNEYERIVQTVTSWPVEDRTNLIRLVMDSMKTESERQNLKMSDILGIAKGGAPPPTDEQVKQWIAEHRMEKYGR